MIKHLNAYNQRCPLCRKFWMGRNRNGYINSTIISRPQCCWCSLHLPKCLFLIFKFLTSGKSSSFDIAPLTILDSGTLQPRKWQLTGINCSIVAQASGYPLPMLTDYWAHSMQPAGTLRPINHATPSPHNPCTLITWITTHLPTPEGWMAELAMLADR